MKTFRSFLDAASVNAFHRLNLSKHTAPKEPMHDVTSDEKKVGNKKAVKVSSKKLSEGKVKVKLNPEKEVGYTVHDVGPGGKKTLVKSGKSKVKDIEEAKSYYASTRPRPGWKPSRDPTPVQNSEPQKVSPAMQAAFDRIDAAFGKKSIKVGGHKTVKEETQLDEISHKLALRAMKKSEKRADDEWEADYAHDRLSDWKTHDDRAHRLRGHMKRKFGNKKIKTDGEDRLGDQGGDGRLGVYSVNTHGKRAGLPPKEQVNRLKSNIKFSLGKHHKPNLPEETQLDELHGKGKLDSIVLAHANAAHKSLRKAREEWRNPTGVLDKAKEHTLDSSKHQILVNRGRAMKHGKYRGADAKTWKAISRMQKEETD